MKTYDEYSDPKSILSDPGLTDDARYELLKNWEHDLRQKLRAGSENMLPLPGVAPKEADLYQRVHQCLSTVVDADS